MSSWLRWCSVGDEGFVTARRFRGSTAARPPLRPRVVVERTASAGLSGASPAMILLVGVLAASRRARLPLPLRGRGSLPCSCLGCEALCSARSGRGSEACGQPSASPQPEVRSTLGLGGARGRSPRHSSPFPRREGGRGMGRPAQTPRTPRATRTPRPRPIDGQRRRPQRGFHAGGAYAGQGNSGDLFEGASPRALATRARPPRRGHRGHGHRDEARGRRRRAAAGTA